MKNRLETIKQIQELIGIPTEYLDKILWTQEEGYNPNYWLRFICEGKKSALYLEGEKWCANQPFELYFLNSVALEAKNPEEEMHLIKKFDKDVDETEAKAWAEDWLLNYLQQSDPYIEEMTYQEIFMRANPRAVNARVSPVEADIRGHVVSFKTDEAFDICRGLQMFATGENYWEIVDNYENPRTGLPSLIKRWKMMYANQKTAMEVAVEALGFSLDDNIDQKIVEWFNNQGTCPVGLCEVNDVAARIIESILKSQNKLD